MTMNGNASEYETRTEIPVGGRAMVMALTAVRDFIAATNCDADTDARLSIIVEELVLNILDHGAPPEDATIGLTIARMDDGDVKVVLTDRGTHFDLRDAAAPGDRPPERGGGAGIALVLAWSDILAYERVGGVNRLALRIRTAT